MLVNILNSILMPHVLAFGLLCRIAMLDVRREKHNTFREELARLWVWIRPLMAHPLYWAATGIATAYFLARCFYE